MAPQTRSRRKQSTENDRPANEDGNTSTSDASSAEEPKSQSTTPNPNSNKTAKKSPSPSSPSPSPSPSPSTLPTPSLTSKSLRMSYVIGPGETGVLTFEPYKSLLLPLWRFRTVPVARRSSSDLFAAFEHYLSAEDFVGADMARKFLQMGMTRAGRYANYAGGRKYEKTTGKQKERSEGHAGREEKLGAKEVFRGVWERARGDGRYAELRERWREEKKGWEKEGKGKREE